MPRRYTKELLEDAAANSVSIAGVLRYLGIKQAGGTQAHIGRRLKEFEVDTSHFLGQGANRGRSFIQSRKTADNTLVVRPAGSTREKTYLLRRAMIECGIEEACLLCGLSGEWNDLPITLHIDHEDGEWLNCTLENLRFLCPNCHSQTETYCKNRGA